MEAVVLGKLGVEGSRQKASLLRRHDATIAQLRYNPGFSTDRFDDWRPDKNSVVRLALRINPFQFGHFQLRFKALRLAAKGVARYGNVHDPQQRLVAVDIRREEDGPRAGAPDGLAPPKRAQRLDQTVGHRQL